MFNYWNSIRLRDATGLLIPVPAHSCAQALCELQGGEFLPSALWSVIKAKTRGPGKGHLPSHYALVLLNLPWDSLAQNAAWSRRQHHRLLTTLRPRPLSDVKPQPALHAAEVYKANTAFAHSSPNFLPTVCRKLSPCQRHAVGHGWSASDSRTLSTPRVFRCIWTGVTSIPSSDNEVQIKTDLKLIYMHEEISVQQVLTSKESALLHENVLNSLACNH